MNQNLIDVTIEKVQRWSKRWPRSVVLWSGGKDSTALLHLIRFKAGIDIPVIQYREPKFRERYAYSDKLIKDWNLEVYDYPPAKVAITDGPDVETGEIRFDMLKYYKWGKNSVVMSLGTERPKLGENFLCGVDDFLQRPTGTFNWPWGAVYIGTKYSDTDLIKGHVPPAMDIRYAEGSPVSLYAMRDWSDKDIFDYLEENGIEPDPTRNIKVDGTWVNNPDKSLNADFYPVCFNCVNRHGDKHAYCPKLNATISNISHLAPYEDVVIPDLGFKPVKWDKKEE
jgi:hypothetical protein